jgi:indole-3-glycerol phosphate synthase
MLETILENKRAEVGQAKTRMPLPELERRLEDAAPARSLMQALAGKKGPGHRIIAEIKRASPSKGVLRSDLDPVTWGEMYQRAGAAAISVLTDEKFFQGSLSHLADIRSNVSDIPLLRKDFILDPYQVWEARFHGADAVLLIVRALDNASLRELLKTTHERGMEALVEVHVEEDLERALGVGARIIGINNRDLKTFTVDTAVTERLMERIPGDVVVVSASGIHGPEQILSLESRGVKAFLIGETLVTARDPEAKLKELVS